MSQCKKPSKQPPACEWCKEPVLPGERNPVGPGDWHAECIFRAVCGSLAHVEHRCGCYVPGSKDTDPPGLTIRQAARAAFCAWLILAGERLPSRWAN